MYSVEDALQKLGLQSKDESLMRGKMWRWLSMYQGRFDPYVKVRTNSGKIKSEHKQNLMLEKMVCSAKSQLLLNEKYKIIVNGNEVAQNVLNDILESNDFGDNINTNYELFACLGMGAVFQVISENGLPEIRYVDGLGVYPITVRNNIITECAFINKDYIKGELHYKITIHLINEDGNYSVRNTLFNAVKGEIITSPSILNYKVYGKYPTFQIYRPTAQNHIDLNSCFGVSIFATAEDVIDTANTIYSSYKWEFQAGKKRVMVASSVMKPVFDGKGGELTRVFDTNDTVYQEIGTSQEPFVKEINMTLRVDEHTKAINDQLNFLSVRTGFGNSYFTFDGMYSKAKTATEVVSKNQELIAAIQRDRLVIEKNLIAMAHCILEMVGMNVGKGDIELTWDDSIFEDESKLDTDVMLLLREGHIDRVWAIKHLLKVTEEEARKISKVPIDDLIKEEQLKQMKKGIVSGNTGIKTEETDLKWNQRDPPDKQMIDDNENGI